MPTPTTSLDDQPLHEFTFAVFDSTDPNDDPTRSIVLMAADDVQAHQAAVVALRDAAKGAHKPVFAWCTESRYWLDPSANAPATGAPAASTLWLPSRKPGEPSRGP